MRVINLTGGHSVDVYRENDFVNLELKGMTWLADGVKGESIVSYPNEGQARMKPEPMPVSSELPGQVVKTEYGEATGIPEGLNGSEVLIVSLPMQSMAKDAGLAEAMQMVAPYKVVRLRSDPSQVLGCMGFTY